MINLLHLIASPFFSGPDRQILELAKTFERDNYAVRSLIVSFSEGGKSQMFLNEVSKAGLPGFMLQNDMPHLWKATKELTQMIKEHQIDLLLLHGHKPRMVGWLAAKRTGIPIIGISRGMTTESWKIALYNWLDQWLHRRMDYVVCVSQGQMDKVLRLTKTPKTRVCTICNAIRTERFDEVPNPQYREKLKNKFQNAPQFILGAAGRFSPEKGFDILVSAVAQLRSRNISVGLVLFGDGFLQETLQKQAQQLDISDFVCFPGFTRELDRFMPQFDVFVQSSHTEGLPNVLLESMAATTAVVATDVGGTAEVVDEGVTGFLAPPNNPDKLADAIQKVLGNDPLRKSMGEKGRERVKRDFTFESQAKKYYELIQTLVKKQSH